MQNVVLFTHTLRSALHSTTVVPQYYHSTCLAARRVTRDDDGAWHAARLRCGLSRGNGITRREAGCVGLCLLSKARLNRVSGRLSAQLCEQQAAYGTLPASLGLEPCCGVPRAPRRDCPHCAPRSRAPPARPVGGMAGGMEGGKAGGIAGGMRRHAAVSGVRRAAWGGLSVKTLSSSTTLTPTTTTTTPTAPTAAPLAASAPERR